MNEKPKGKIGRLPGGIQEQVNRRMENGEKGKATAAWLNSLPEVQAVLAAEFGGAPIREQNLSEWRKRGYKNWLRWRKAQAMAAERGALPVAGDAPLMEQMTGWASVYYLMAVRELVEAGEGSEEPRTSCALSILPRLKALREFCRDVVTLQRGEYSGVRLKLEQERLALRTAKSMVRAQTYKQNGVEANSTTTHGPQFVETVVPAVLI